MDAVGLERASLFGHSMDQDSLGLDREVLAYYGNMSAPTVLFVLERAVASGLTKRFLVNAWVPVSPPVA